MQQQFNMDRRSLPKHAPMSEAAKNSEKELMLYRNRVLIDRVSTRAMSRQREERLDSRSPAPEPSLRQQRVSEFMENLGAL